MHSLGSMDHGIRPNRVVAADPETTSFQWRCFKGGLHFDAAAIAEANDIQEYVFCRDCFCSSRQSKPKD